MATKIASATLRSEPHRSLCETLLAEGFCVVPNLMPVGDVALLATDLAPHFDATPFCEGGFYGARTKRFGSLLKRSRHAPAFIQHPQILEMAQAVLGPWCDTIQLNLAQALELHPGALPQFPHRDQDMWGGQTGEIEYLINVMWPFTDYRADNGTTLIWPNSHAANALTPEPPEKPVAVECSPGSAIVFLGSTLHGAGGNQSSDVRRGMIVSYCLGWLKPYENQWLVYPPEVARTFAPSLAALVGYQQHRPNLGNYEGQCPSILLGEQRLDHLGAIDALRPDQAAALEEFLEDQRRLRVASSDG